MWTGHTEFARRVLEWPCSYAHSSAAQRTDT